nr:hypothetical protein CFP56_43772 [Quercus suber]
MTQCPPWIAAPIAGSAPPSPSPSPPLHGSAPRPCRRPARSPARPRSSPAAAPKVPSPGCRTGPATASGAVRACPARPATRWTGSNPGAGSASIARRGAGWCRDCCGEREG